MSTARRPEGSDRATLLSLPEIRSQISHMSGGGKKLMPNRRENGIYTSVTLPGLDDMVAVRDSRVRVTEFLGGADVRLDGKTFIDIGANVGGMLFEFARRGAICTGVEFRDDRVQLMRSIANYYSEHGHVGRLVGRERDDECVMLDHRYTEFNESAGTGCEPHGPGVHCAYDCPRRLRIEDIGWEWQCAPECLADPLSQAEFYAADFNQRQLSPIWASRQYDAVLCSAVDNYIDDKHEFYRLLRSLVTDSGTLYYECNINRGSYPVESVVSNMREAGFGATEYLGVGQDQFLRRKIYRVTP
jgi:hypothetical protein